MPRSGTPPYAYSLPAVYLAVAGQVITPASHNTPLQDIATTLNTAQPIQYGGTAATTVAGAQTNLGITPIDRLSFPTAGGTADAITVSNTSPISGLVNRTLSSFRASADALGDITINVDDFGFRKLMKVFEGTTIQASGLDVADKQLYNIVYFTAEDSPNGAWVLVNPGFTELNGVAISTSFIQTSIIYLRQSTDPTPTTEGDVAWSTLFNHFKVGDGVGTKRFLPGPAPGALYGCAVTNNVADATNDMDFAAGIAADSTNAFYLIASALTKRLDAAWAVGTNQGGLFSGSVADGTYHCFEIMRPDTGVVDAGFDTSVTAANRPADYTYYRRVRSIVRSGGAIILTLQNGNDITFTATPLQVSQNNPGTSAVTRTLTGIPTGIVVTANVGHATSDLSITSPTYGVLTPLAATDVTPSVSVFDTGIVSGGGAADAQGSTRQIQTNTSAQIRSRISQSDADITEYINIFGYTDLRGTMG